MSLIAAAALAITFTLIVSPNTHPYDMGLFFIPILYVTNRLGSKLWVIILVVIIFLLPNIYVSLSIVRFFFLLACLGYILRLITTDRRFVERSCK